MTDARSPLCHAAFDLALVQTSVNALEERLSIRPTCATPSGFSIADQFSHVSVSVNASRRIYHYEWRSIWADAQGRKQLFSASPASKIFDVEPWDGCRPLPFAEKDGQTHYKLMLEVRAVWAEMAERLVLSLRAGQIKASARLGSHLSEPLTIPADAWHSLEIVDWPAGELCSGRSGERMFDTQVICGDHPNRRPPGRPPTASRRAKQLMDQMYDGEPPTNHTIEAIQAAMAEYCQLNGEPPPPSESTIRTVLGRK